MKRLFIALCFVAIIAPVVHVSALSDKEALVVDRCDLIKQTLDKQRRRDLVSRINRGRDYQNLIDQQQALVSRLKNNSMDFTQFEQRLNELKFAFESFRSAYTAYDDSLVALMQVDCKKDPAHFLIALETTRRLRAEVGQKTITIKDILRLQRELIVALRNQLQQIEQSIVGER